MRRLRDVGRAWIGICWVSANRSLPPFHLNVWCLSCARGSGLRKVLKEGESVPEIFEDPVVKRAGRWVLSTSALFSKHLREYGWGEVRLFCLFFFRPSWLTNCYAGRAGWLWCPVHHRFRRYMSDAMGDDLSLTPEWDVNRLFAIHDHVARRDAQRGVRDGDLACGGRPVCVVFPRGSTTQV